MDKITNKISDLSAVPVYAAQFNELIDDIGDMIPYADKITISGDDINNGKIAIGYQALASNDLPNNVGIGYRAGLTNPTGFGNTFIGTSAGWTTPQINGVNYSIAIGNGASTTKNYQAVLGNRFVGETITRGVNINTHSSITISIASELTAAQVLSGVIAGNSADAYTLTLPTATALLAALNNGGNYGTTFDLYVHCIGAGTITIAVGDGISVSTPAITGGQLLQYLKLMQLLNLHSFALILQLDQ